MSTNSSSSEKSTSAASFPPDPNINERIDAAARRVYNKGRERKEKNVYSGPGRYGRGHYLPLVADHLADAHYMLSHRQFKTAKLNYLRVSLLAAIKVAYGLASVLQQQLKVYKTEEWKKLYKTKPRVSPYRRRSPRLQRPASASQGLSHPTPRRARQRRTADQ